jgi:hypothetical protein
MKYVQRRRRNRYYFTELAWFAPIAVSILAILIGVMAGLMI